MAEFNWRSLEWLKFAWLYEDDSNRDNTHAGYRSSTWMRSYHPVWFDPSKLYEAPDRRVPHHTLAWFTALDWFSTWRVPVDCFDAHMAGTREALDNVIAGSGGAP